MTFLLLSMVLIGATYWVVRPTMETETRPHIAITGTQSVQLLFLAVFLAATTMSLGALTALAFLAALALHEAGLVVGHRLAGHESLRFRVMPGPRSGPVSAEAHPDDLAHFFATLMGPALGLAPMVLAFALADLFDGTALAPAFGALALSIGAFNFIALLPLWPLPGGTLVQILLRTGFPKVSAIPVAALFLALASLAWSTNTPALFLAALIGALAYAIRPPLPKDRAPLAPQAVRLGLAAYLALLSAFFMGGWWVILLFTGQM